MGHSSRSWQTIGQPATRPICGPRLRVMNSEPKRRGRLPDLEKGLVVDCDLKITFKFKTAISRPTYLQVRKGAEPPLRLIRASALIDWPNASLKLNGYESS